MNESRGGPEPELLVATEDQSFGSAVVDAVEGTGVAASAERVEPVAGELRRDGVEGAIVDGRIAEPAAVVERLTGKANLPVVVLTDSAGDDDTVARAIEAGATDVFPRTTASTQYELIVDRIENATQPTATADGSDHARPESERRFQVIAEHVDEAVYLSSADLSELLYVNSAHEDIYGKPVEDLYEDPRSVIEAAHPDDRERYERDIERLVDEVEAGDPDDVYEGQYRLRRDGETKWVNVARFPVENDDGTVDRIAGRVRDVTDRRRIERRLRAILERIDEAIYVTWAEELTTPSPHPDDFYAGYEDVWGQSLEEIFDTYEEGFFGTLHPEERPGFRSFVAGIGEDLDSGNVSDRYSREYRIERTDGEIRWIRSDFYPTEWETGPLRMVTVSRDVTERKRREREYEQIFNSVQDAITVHDPKTGEMVDVNDTFCELVGYDHETILEMGTTGISVEEEGYTEEYAEEIIAEVMSEGENGPYEWMVETKDGERRVTEVVATRGKIGGEERIISINRDVTERKRREREYEQIFNGVNDSITIHDPETGELLEVNDALCDLVGHDREEIIESGVMEYTPSGQGYTVEEAKEFIREVVETGEPKRTEWAVETADGEIRQLEVTGTTVEIGGDLRYVAIDRDITERKRREQEFEQIFNGVNDGITIHDPDTGEILDANETYLDIFGHEDVETLRERGIGGLSVTEEGYTEERARALINDVAVSEEPRTVEWQIETADGEQRWFESTVAPAEIAGEKRVLAIQRDVTERKRRQREFEQIFNGVQDAIVVLDPDTVEILDANEAFLDMFGYGDIDEVRERGVSGLSVTEEGYTEQRGREINQRVAESGQPETFEWKNETRSGERIWLGVKVAPAVIGGEQRTIAIHRDITDRKRREQRLEVFNRILRHNLRNQLDVIQSHAKELADRTTDDHADRIVASVDELAAIGRRARQVDRILSKDDTPTRIDVAETLRETVRAMEPERSDVAVTTELPKGVHLQTDKESITMAVESALENALEHAASAVTVALEDGPDGCVITIADDGPGIPEEELMPIEAETETRLQHGSGLGLWQLRWCVDNLNGELSFETEAGATVRITVPDRRESGRAG